MKLRPPSRSSLPVVKRAAPRKPSAPKLHCVVCGAALRDDHGQGDLVCDSHARRDGNPRCDPPTPMNLTPEERLLVMLYRAAGRPLNLYRAFGCPSTDTNVAAFRDMVRRLNRSGLVCIKGRKRIGYELASQSGRASRNVGL